MLFPMKTSIYRGIPSAMSVDGTGKLEGTFGCDNLTSLLSQCPAQDHESYVATAVSRTAQHRSGPNSVQVSTEQRSFALPVLRRSEKLGMMATKTPSKMS